MSDEFISQALKMIPYGFYVVTTRAGDDRNAMVLNWFTQVSFEPQHIVLGLQRSSYSHGLLEKSKVFGLNIFGKDGEETIKLFSKSRAKNPEKFASANFSDGPETGVPVLDEAAAFLECEVLDFVDTGSGHDVVIAKVVGAGVRKAGKPEDTFTLQDIGWSYAG